MDLLKRIQMNNIIASGIQRNSGYLARVEIDKIISETQKKDDLRLEPFGFKVYSQGDEDGIIEEIFRRLGVDQGMFLEIGVENGLECNTLYLLHKGWRGYWIEGNSSQRDSIINKFESLINKKRLGVVFSLVYPENFSHIYEKLTFEEDGPDFVSIDIDGNDIYLLESMPCRPKVICIEYNAKFRPNISKRPVYSPKNFWRGGDYAGSSLLAITEVADAMGYQLVATNITGANAFYVRKDLAVKLFPTAFSSDDLYNPPRYWLIFDHYNHIGHPADFGPYADLEK